MRMNTPHAYPHMVYVAIRCLPTATIKEVALSIQSILKSRKAMLLSKQIFNEKENHTLRDCGIQRGSILHLTAHDIVYTCIPSLNLTFPSKFTPSQPMSQFPIFVQEEGKRIPIAVQPHTSYSCRCEESCGEKKAHFSKPTAVHLFCGKLLEDKSCWLNMVSAENALFDL